MYITPRQKKRSITITAIVAIAIPLTVVAAYFVTQLFIGASSEADPKDVIVSNVTSNSITISWSTDVAATGTVTVRKGGSDSKPYIDTRGSDRRKTHYVEVTDLDPNIEYAFTILSNNTKYVDEKGAPFKFKTTPITGETPIPQPLYGSVSGANGNDYIAYIVVDSDSSVYPASGSLNSGGNWIIDTSALRDGTNSLFKVENDTRISVVIRGKDGTGAKLSGPFGEVFNDSGSLRNPDQLSIGPLSSFASLFPSKAVITKVIAEVPDPPPITPPPIPNPDPDPDPDPEPEPEPEPDEERQFRKVLDVMWTPIEGTDGSDQGVTRSLLTGLDSVKITNVTDTSFTVIWLTDSKVTGKVKYGTDEESFNSEAIDERDGLLGQNEYYSHSVKVTKLQPETVYYFIIESGSDIIDDDGISFGVETYPTLGSPPEFKTISGKINGLQQDAVVYAQIVNQDTSGSIGDSTIVSSVVDENGGWIATYGDMRTESGSEYYNSSEQDIMEINLLTLAEVSTVSESMKNIDSKTITIDISPSSQIRKIIKVIKLEDYGVY